MVLQPVVLLLHHHRTKNVKRNPELGRSLPALTRDPTRWVGCFLKPRPNPGTGLGWVLLRNPALPTLLKLNPAAPFLPAL
jgi:hypothetical protein